jgi:hypothetical protein
MIYGFGLNNNIYMRLLRCLPTGSIQNLSQYYKIITKAKKGDLIIVFNWGNAGRIIQKTLMEKEINVFPRSDFSLLIAIKIEQLKIINEITNFKLERLYQYNNIRQSFNVPRLKNSIKTVVKIGDEHQGLNKFLKKPNEIITTKKNIIFEEYLNNARSIRICIINKEKIDDIFIIEQTNSKYALENPETVWIKNISPIETVYSYRDRYKSNIKNIDNIIEDALNITNYFNHDYLGLDYVITDEKTGLLEVNDMIGLADNDEIFESAVIFFKKLIEDHQNKTT